MAHSFYVDRLIGWAGDSVTVKENCPRGDLDIITVSETMQEGYDINATNKALVCQLIQMKHYSQAKNHTVSGGGRNYVPGAYGGGNQRQRVSTRYDSVPYDRLCMFADLAEKESGRCFVICFTNVMAGAKFFNHLPSKVEPGVGSIFVIEEPRQVKGFLGTNDSVPIIDKWSRIVPMSVPVSKCLSFVPLERSEAGRTSYFSCNGATNLKLHLASVVGACCNGSFCDRQVSSELEGTKCGCFHITSEYKKGTGKVLEVSVELPVPTHIDHLGYVVASDFRSYRFSNLFIEKSAWEAIEIENADHQRKLRDCVAQVFEYFNANGGFTYIGWKRVGITQDVSDPNNTNVASDTQVPHISYLFPTNEHLVFDSDNHEYKSLRLTKQKLQSVVGNNGEANNAANNAAEANNGAPPAAANNVALANNAGAANGRNENNGAAANDAIEVV